MWLFLTINEHVIILSFGNSALIGMPPLHPLVLIKIMKKQFFIPVWLKKYIDTLVIQGKQETIETQETFCGWSFITYS